MYLIKDKNNRFIKKTIDNQITFTNSESLADAFPSEREANDVIRKIFTKKNRKNYKAVWRDINPVPESTIGKQQNDESSDDTYMLSIKGFDEVISTHLTPEIEKHLQKLQDSLLQETAISSDGWIMVLQASESDGTLLKGPTSILSNSPTQTAQMRSIMRAVSHTRP